MLLCLSGFCTMLCTAHGLVLISKKHCTRRGINCLSAASDQFCLKCLKAPFDFQALRGRISLKLRSRSPEKLSARLARLKFLHDPGVFNFHHRKVVCVQGAHPLFVKGLKGCQWVISCNDSCNFMHAWSISLSWCFLLHDICETAYLTVC